MKRLIISSSGIAILAFIGLVYCWHFVFDTTQRRKRVTAYANYLTSAARNNPSDDEFARALLDMANSTYEFEAGTAAARFCDLGPAASPILDEIAHLMWSSNAVVSREAANSLEKLGPIAKPVLPQLIRRIQKPALNDVRLFAIDAATNFPCEAKRYLPILKSVLASEISTSSNYFIQHLQDAIDQLIESDCTKITSG